jgi:hypothetical protein
VCLVLCALRASFVHLCALVAASALGSWWLLLYWVSADKVLPI